MSEWMFDVVGRKAKHTSGMVIHAVQRDAENWEVKPVPDTLPIRSIELSHEDNETLDMVISQRVTEGGQRLVEMIVTEVLNGGVH